MVVNKVTFKSFGSLEQIFKHILKINIYTLYLLFILSCSEYEVVFIQGLAQKLR